MATGYLLRETSLKLLDHLDQAKIEEHLSGRGADYNGRGQVTWFAG